MYMASVLCISPGHRGCEQELDFTVFICHELFCVSIQCELSEEFV